MKKTKRKAVAVVQIGSRMHYAVPEILYDTERLAFLITDGYLKSKLLSKICRSDFVKRNIPLLNRALSRNSVDLPHDKVICSNFSGLAFAARRSFTRDAELRESDIARLSSVLARRLQRKCDVDPVAAVWAFNGAALESFEVAKKYGSLCILEQTILPKKIEREILKHAETDFPDWSAFAGYGISSSIIEERELLEWKLADRILCASEFVKAGLIDCGVSPSKVHVIPYGVKAGTKERGLELSSRFSDTNRDERLRALFVGEVGIRKGVPILLQALSEIPASDICLKLAGRVSISSAKVSACGDNVEFLGFRGRDEIDMLFSWADVFVLPSLVEGSATVTYEAACRGVPVLTTPNSGSQVIDGKTGFIVPAGNAEHLASTLKKIISRKKMGREILSPKDLVYAASISAYDRYKEDLTQFFDEVLDGFSVTAGRSI